MGLPLWAWIVKKETGDTSVHIWNRMKSSDGGIYYEINQSHPLIQQLLISCESPKQLQAVLHQIERGLPLNQLYVDLNNDEQLKNDCDQSEAEIESAVRAMIDNCHNIEEKLSILEAISKIEPFLSYQEILRTVKKEIVDNECAKC